MDIQYIQIWMRVCVYLYLNVYTVMSKLLS
jgi:hypothetical protein